MMKCKFCLLCLCLSLSFFMSGCAAPGGPPVAALDANINIAERAPGSLEFDVMEYSWTYLNNGAHIRIRGTVRNTSAKTAQSVTLLGALYDQNGRLVASGTSYVAPTYLKPGAVGEFEITGVARRDSGVRNTRLVSNCQSNAI